MATGKPAHPSPRFRDRADCEQRVVFKSEHAECRGGNTIEPPPSMALRDRKNRRQPAAPGTLVPFSSPVTTTEHPDERADPGDLRRAEQRDRGRHQANSGTGAFPKIVTPVRESSGRGCRCDQRHCPWRRWRPEVCPRAPQRISRSFRKNGTPRRDRPESLVESAPARIVSFTTTALIAVSTLAVSGNGLVSNSAR